MLGIGSYLHNLRLRLRLKLLPLILLCIRDAICCSGMPAEACRANFLAVAALQNCSQQLRALSRTVHASGQCCVSSWHVVHSLIKFM